MWLARRNNPFAYLAGIALVTAVAWTAGYVTPPATWFSAPDFSSVFLKLDVAGALQLALVPAIITVMMTDLFDSLSTFIGVAHAANLVDEKGEPKNLRQGLIVDAFATLGAGLFGTLLGHGLRGEHCRHSHGRTHRPHGGGHGAAAFCPACSSPRSPRRFRTTRRRRC